MAKYDIESFLDELDAFLKANLNTKLAEIDAEKNDGITLKALNSAAFFQQTLNNAIANYDPYVHYGIVEVETEGTGPGAMKTYRVDVHLIVGDQGTDQYIVKRVLRYSRALEELFEENFAVIRRGLKIKVASMVPEEIVNLNTSNEFRSVGVSITLALA